VELPNYWRKKWLKEGKLEVEGQVILVLPTVGEDINPNKPLKQCDS
jgi:hypothetical protein